jgi:hypothetical protein
MSGLREPVQRDKKKFGGKKNYLYRLGYLQSCHATQFPLNMKTTFPPGLFSKQHSFQRDELTLESSENP